MSQKHLTYIQRQRLEKFVETSGSSLKIIAREFDCNIATIYRELKRGAYTDKNGFRRYSAYIGQATVENRKRKIFKPII